MLLMFLVDCVEVVEFSILEKISGKWKVENGGI